MVPSPFDRIEIRSIRWKPFHHEPMSAIGGLPKQTNCFAMNAVTVQNQNKLSPQVSVENPKKRHRLFGADILGVDMKVQSQTLPFRGNTDSGNDRKTVMTIPVVLNRRFAFRCPCSPKHRLQHKASFINKSDAISLAVGFFLYAANLTVANVGLLSRSVRGPCVRASGNSTQANVGCTRHGRDDTLLQRSTRLPRPLADMSTGLCRTQP